MRWWNTNSIVTITFLLLQSEPTLFGDNYISLMMYRHKIWSTHDGVWCQFPVPSHNRLWPLASSKWMFCGYQTASCPSLVYTGISASCLLIVNYRNFLVFANGLVQSAVIKYLVYINQIPRKDFFFPISFDFLQYALQSAGTCFTRSKDQPWGVITLWLSL